MNVFDLVMFADYYCFQSLLSNILKIIEITTTTIQYTIKTCDACITVNQSRSMNSDCMFIMRLGRSETTHTVNNIKSPH